MNRPVVYIERAGLPVRVSNLLRRCGIVTLNHVSDMTVTLLLDLNNLGPQSLRAIEDALERHPEVRLTTKRRAME